MKKVIFVVLASVVAASQFGCVLTTLAPILLSVFGLFGGL